MVSARAISSTLASAASRASDTTRSCGTSPSNGQPKAVEKVTEIGGPPSAFWRAAMACMAAICSATSAPWLRIPKLSDAQTTTLASSQPVATARSQPRMFSTRPMRDRPEPAGRAAMISSAPAICGTRFGLTKETTSIRLAPAACSRRMKSSF